jgi:Protein of unknown function (DUF2752)
MRAAAKPESRRHALLGLAAALLLAACTATLLLRLPPEQYHFYPQCPIHLWLHLECPGCGATRALAALLRGHLRNALRLNALFVAGVLPTATLYAAATLFRLLRPDPFRWPALPGPQTLWISAGLALALSFSLLRNLHG